MLYKISLEFYINKNQDIYRNNTYIDISFTYDFYLNLITLCIPYVLPVTQLSE
ncbi:hypothetical protein E18064_410004 [Elizabethkingia anophelis]|nr:hypothetical protein E18064_410004 [Elizabethkingia anophelis]